jgi:molybdopterin synthase catalytic subunit
MQVRVLPFGVLKDRLGTSLVTVELRDGASIAELLQQLSEGGSAQWFRGIAVSVNAEFATATCVLSDGDEVGLLPPVSGGNALPVDRPGQQEGASPSVVALTRELIDAEKLIASVKRDEDGAVLVFDGIVRNHSRGRRTLYLDYEAYEELALKQMHVLIEDAIRRFDVRGAWIVHRLGRLEIGETSVLIIVASAHRAQAFEASRWLIDTLKKTVPIWKKETFVDGAVWAAGEPFPSELAVDALETPHDS